MEVEINFLQNTDNVLSKLILLYLIDKMDIPLSNSQISQFALEENLMSYFVLQQTLAELVQDGYLDKAQSNNTTRYTVIAEGSTALEYFENNIPQEIRTKINKYVFANRQTVKKEFETAANYFYDQLNNEFNVKCGIYENDKSLMEINVSVATKSQARLICSNWKNGVSKMYGNILKQLIEYSEENTNNSNISKTESQ